jgi:hypothetical protein
MTVKFGWKAGSEQYPPQQLLEYAVAAEEAGFESIDVSDHFHPWSEQGQACFVWTWLGAAAVRTQKIMLGTGVTCPILRYHPAIIAQAAATLAAFAPGRSFLGLGNWGSPQRVFSYRTVAKLPNSSGAAARSGSIDSRTMERRSSFIQWNLLQDTQSEALYASGDFPTDRYLSAGCQKRAICGAIRRRTNHGRRREFGNVQRDFEKFRCRGDGGGEGPGSNAADDRNCRGLQRQ